MPSRSANGRDVVRRSGILLQTNPPTLDALELAVRADRSTYRSDLSNLQNHLKEVALAYHSQGRRALVVFEGCDASGKGGAIRRISWPLDPRGLKVWPISAPSVEEKSQHYLYRFWKRLPRAGQMVIFDRSWYGRVLVERVEQFATEVEWSRAYEEINEFERMLTDDGIRLVKLYLHISKEVQLQRFRARLSDPLRRWKLSEEDIRNRDRWSDYLVATDEMFAKTSTVQNPWIVIPGNDKKYARLAVIETVVQALSRGVDIRAPVLDPAFEERLRTVLGDP